MADIYPLDPATDLGRLRVLVNDTEQYAEYVPEGSTDAKAYMFSDVWLTVYIEQFPTLFHAAAACIDMLATNEALVSKKIRTEDLSTDGAAVANSLRAHAIVLRAQGEQDLAKAAETDGAVEIIEFTDPVTKWDRFEYDAVGGLNWL